MALYKRGDVWWYEFIFRGQRIQESSKVKNKQVAKQIESARRTQLVKGTVGIDEPEEKGPAPIFAHYAEGVLKLLKAKAKRTGTLEFYRSKLQRLLEFPKLANAELDAIDKRMINEYITFARRPKIRKVRVDGKLVSRKYQIAPATVNRQLATLRMILFHALEEGVIAAVPKIGKAMLPGERQREFVLLPELEPIYLEAAPQPLADAALLMLDTGLRVGEALGLSWTDVHLKPTSASKFGYIHVGKGKTKNAVRDVPLTPRANRLLTARKLAGKSPWVFPNESGTGSWAVTSLDHQHDRVRTLLKMPADFVVHSLRHTMLTRLGLSGADVFTIKKIAGHSSVQVSERYVHPSSESKERAIERMMAEYGHIGVHDSVETVDEAKITNTPCKSPYSRKSVESDDSRKLLQ